MCSSPCIGRPDAGEADDKKGRKRNVDALLELRVDSGRNLNRPDDRREDEHHDRKAGHLPDRPHG